MASRRAWAARASALLLCALAALVPLCAGEEASTATFYGGFNAAGTMGGACGYGNLYDVGYGTDTAAASLALFQKGAICGACFEVRCVRANPPVCRQDAKVVVTITNLCPQGSEGGWCDFPKHHLDMAYPAWAKIASNPIAGVVRTMMRRVPCPRKGGISFRISGNPYWIQIMISNVAGSGDLSAVSISTDGGNSWRGMDRNWGAIWSVGGKLQGKALSFKLKAFSSSDEITIKNAIPSSWHLGGTYKADGNFGSGGGGSGGGDGDKNNDNSGNKNKNNNGNKSGDYNNKKKNDYNGNKKSDNNNNDKKDYNPPKKSYNPPKDYHNYSPRKEGSKSNSGGNGDKSYNKSPSSGQNSKRKWRRRRRKFPWWRKGPVPKGHKPTPKGHIPMALRWWRKKHHIRKKGHSKGRAHQ